MLTTRATDVLVFVISCSHLSCCSFWGFWMEICPTKVKKMQLTGSESSTLFFPSYFFLCRSWQHNKSSYGSVHLPQSGPDRFLTSWQTGQCQFLINSCNPTWTPVSEFLIFSACPQRRRGRRTEKKILLGFAMSHTSKGARWERSDASKGEDSGDGGKDGPGRECTKKKEAK